MIGLNVRCGKVNNILNLVDAEKFINDLIKEKLDEGYIIKWIYPEGVEVKYPENIISLILFAFNNCNFKSVEFVFRLNVYNLYVTVFPINHKSFK